jgi:L-cysteine S-thiosulfotransferase
MKQIILFVVASLALTTAFAADTRQSGYQSMRAETRALQDDDTQNPAMLWVEEGRALWSKSAANGKSCADCHGEASKSMRGVAARYPAFSSSAKRPINLAQQINVCRTTKQKSSVLPLDDQTLLSLESVVAYQSRGLPISPPPDKRLNAARRLGEKLFHQRIGQLDLSCKDCHTDNAGKSLAGNAIPEAHPTGYPLYRLEWQALGSLQRRLRNCMVGVRAEPYAAGSAEMIALEVYLAVRAKGMEIESPAVRP